MSVDAANDIGSKDNLKLLVRGFGWAVLAHFVVWMVSNVLTHSYDWPGALSLFKGGASALTYVQWAAYIVVIGLTVVWVSRSRVHIPMMILGLVVALRAKTLGFHWLALLIVVAELAIVITRFVFSYEQAFMGDLVRFWYAALFLFASAYTLLEDGHVRVDIFYAGMKNSTKGFLNAISTILLGISLCWTILIVCLDGKGSIVYGPVVNFEVSQSGFGMYVKYLMASFLVIFAITMLIQFVSYLMESVADYRDEDGTRLNREVEMH